VFFDAVRTILVRGYIFGDKFTLMAHHVYAAHRTDTACLCSHPAFADATNLCAGSACMISEDLSSVNGVLNNMCSAQLRQGFLKRKH